MARSFRDIIRDSAVAQGGLLDINRGGIVNAFLRNRLTPSQPSGFGPNMTPTGVSDYQSGTQTPIPQNVFDSQSVMGSVPVNEVRANGLGVDPSAIMNLPVIRQKGGRAGGGTAGAAAAPDRAALPGEAEYQPQYVQLPDGRVFDVSDPAQRQAFFDARNALIDAEITRQFNIFADEQRRAMADAEREYGRALETSDTDIADLERQLNDYNQQNLRTIGDVNQAYDLGTVNRQNFFAQVSPLAYQSAQGQGQQFAAGQRDLALSDINQATEQTRQNAMRQEGELRQQRSDLETGYNRFIQDARSGLENYRRQLQEQAAGQRSELAGNLAPLDVAQGINTFQYNRSNASPLASVNADVSQYTPYLTFDALGGSPEANFFKGFKPQSTNKLKPVDQFLGYNPTEKAKKNPVNAFLRG